MREVREVVALSRRRGVVMGEREEVGSGRAGVEESGHVGKDGIG